MITHDDGTTQHVFGETAERVRRAIETPLSALRREWIDGACWGTEHRDATLAEIEQASLTEVRE